ncbi:conjugal transfer protein, partial [Henriciella mobilis]
GLQLWIPGLVLWAVGHSAAVFMARSDPDFMAVAGRSTRHKEHLTC